MRVAYESPRVTLYCGDAREVLPTLGKETIDEVVTDPPYGREWRSNTRRTRFDPLAGDGKTEAQKLLTECAANLVRVTRRTRHIYTFGLPVEHELLAVKAQLIWDKGRIGSGDLSVPWGPSYEPIFFHARAADRANLRSGTLAARLRRESVINVRRLSAKQVNRHPTEKPVALMRQLVETSSVMGEIVLDPFAGVGSTLVAAAITGRRSIGIELDDGYCEIAAERLRRLEKALDEVEAA